MNSPVSFKQTEFKFKALPQTEVRDQRVSANDPEKPRLKNFC